MSGSRVTVSAMITSDVEVEVEPDDLIAAGWVRGEDDTENAEAVTSAIERWHIETHTGAFLWCLEQPCEDVVKASGR